MPAKFTDFSNGAQAFSGMPAPTPARQGGGGYRRGAKTSGQPGAMFTPS